MTVTDTISGFKSALKTLLETISGINHVSLDSKPIDAFTTDQYPLIRIDEMECAAVHYLTSAETNIVVFNLVIAAKASTSDDTLSGYTESILDLLYNNPQVSNTCDYCLSSNQFAPMEWEETQYKIRIMVYRVMLRRSL